MATTDLRGALLRDAQGHAADFAGECANRFEGGHGVARQQEAALIALAGAIVRAVDEWRLLARDLELERAFDAARAGDLVAESVFDELLCAGAWRLLTAALALAWPTS